MSNSPDPQAAADANSVALCPVCGTANADWDTYCVRCARAMPFPEAAAHAEIGHITYLLHQLTGWRAHALVSPAIEARIKAEYAARRQALRTRILRGRTEGWGPVAEGQVAPDSRAQGTARNGPAPVVPPLPPNLAPAGGQTAYNAAHSPMPTLAAATSSLEGAGRPGVPSPRPPSLIPHPSPAGGFPRTSALLQEHGLKIVFALAALLVLAALRSMIAWDWVDAVVVRLAPLVLIGLTGLFWIFGLKTRRENPWAAFVFHGMVALLVGFNIIAANRYWLAGMLPMREAVALAFAVAALVSGAMLLRWKEIPYLHLFQIGALGTVYTCLQWVRTLALPPVGAGDFRPLPLPLFGGAYLLCAACCVAAARVARTAGPRPHIPDDKETVRPGAASSGAAWALAWTLWACLAIVGMLLIAALDAVVGGGVRPDDFALLALLTGFLFGAGAQLLEDPRMVYAAGGFLIGSEALWVFGNERPGRYGFGFLLLALSAGASALAAFDAGKREERQSEQGSGNGAGAVQNPKSRSVPGEKYAPPGLAAAWDQIAQVGVVLATGLLWWQVVDLLTLSAAPAAREAPSSVLLGLLCGGYYWLFAWQRERSVFLYGALSCWGVALVSGLYRIQAPAGAFAIGLTAYGIALCSLAAKADERDRAGSARRRAWLRPEWELPLALSGHVAAALGTTLATLVSGQYGLTMTWAWTAITLTMAAALYGVTARRDPESPAGFAALGCAAGAASLLTWRVLPHPATWADCLAPFALLTACGASLAGRAAQGGGQGDAPGIPVHDGTADGGGSTQSGPGRSSPATLWKDPLAMASLAAVAAMVVDCGLRMLAGIEPRYALAAVWISQGALGPARQMVVSLLPAFVAACLLFAARRNQPAQDAVRSLAAGMGLFAAALEIGALCGLSAGIAHWTAPPIRRLAVGLVLLAWGCRLLGRLIRQKAGEQDLTVGALLTALAGALAAASAVLWPGKPVGAAILLVEGVFAGAFALFYVELYVTQEAPAIVGSAVVFGLALAANATQPAPEAVGAVPLWTLLALAAAGAYLLPARRLANAALVRWSWWPVVGGWALFAFWRAFDPIPARSLHTGEALWGIGLAGIAWAYGRAALWSRCREFAVAAGIALTGAYVCGLSLFARHPVFPLAPAASFAVEMLPFLGILYVAAARWTGEAAVLLGAPLRRTCLAISGPALCGSVASLYLFWDSRSVLIGPVTWTLLAYGVAYAAVALHRRTPAPVAACAVTLTAAYVHVLFARTTLFIPTAPLLTWPRFAFLTLQAAVGWTVAGAYLQHARRRTDLASPLLSLAAAISLACAALALPTVQESGQGLWSILTLAWAGAVWFGLWVLCQADLYLHVGVWNLLVAWWLIVYDKTPPGVFPLDLDLLPVGLYLIALGHLADRRKKPEAAALFWWSGLLIALTPAFLAYWQRFPTWHSVLLIAECLAAVLWGVAHRLRVFAGMGLGYAALFAAAVQVGHMPDIWGAFVALAAGVALFIAGFYILTHRDTLQRWMTVVETRWRTWR